MKKKSGCGGGCLGAPMRALSRACDSACDLYVRGMSGCARRVPSGSSAGVVGRGFGGTGAASLRLRVSSESADDLVRAAAAARRHQRRVAAEPAEEGAGYDGAGKTKAGAAARQGRVAPEPEKAVGYYGAAGKKGGAGAVLVSAAAPAVRGPALKKGGAAAMGTIAEDEPCEFGPDGACAVVPSLKPQRRAGFGAVKAGSGDDAFAR
ncbi:hypothetical protein SETIT_5G330700v2 [Setaria italica]|uniref:Uncharacterized protein n=1 Tax=Setaria italica TaxID=4555 RepID=A0A368RBG2_SETIT|nr:uncharacterized protein LOC101755568 [Setaria italica]RCV27511.1 hypothetical protein SETIT_5G330700v2 [Setaria italica]